MTFRKRLLAALSSLALAFGLGLVATQPAEALTNDWTKVCNSDYSVAEILVKVYDDPSWGYFQVELNSGQCTGTIYNAHDNIRVDTEYQAGILMQVHSYKIGEIGVGWGPCHDDSDNSASNPPDSYNVNGIRYRNYHTYHC